MRLQLPLTPPHPHPPSTAGFDPRTGQVKTCFGSWEIGYDPVSGMALGPVTQGYDFPQEAADPGGAGLHAAGRGAGLADISAAAPGHATTASPALRGELQAFLDSHQQAVARPDAREDTNQGERGMPITGSGAWEAGLRGGPGRGPEISLHSSARHGTPCSARMQVWQRGWMQVNTSGKSSCGRVRRQRARTSGRFRVRAGTMGWIARRNACARVPPLSRT